MICRRCLLNNAVHRSLRVIPRSNLISIPYLKGNLIFYSSIKVTSSAFWNNGREFMQSDSLPWWTGLRCVGDMSWEWKKQKFVTGTETTVTEVSTDYTTTRRGGHCPHTGIFPLKSRPSWFFPSKTKMGIDGRTASK
uniref:Uncharacterized protein n=1 Tax=Pyxicephalus adspersus TaxID=30357 RepID=A0AAV2ZPT5_PYXAD|nr:TPA: hypothetical protein GDO54_003917 [Pyxicephalus adspersus]